MDKDKTILNYKDIGARIRLERENLNLTREKLAEITELSPFYIGQIERGDRKMSLATMAKIAKVLHISTDYLLSGSTQFKNMITKDFSVSEASNRDYDQSIGDELDELLSILARCSKKEIRLIKDMVKLIIPYINR